MQMKLAHFLFKFFLITILIVLSTALVSAQLFPPTSYPQHYFQWPLKAKIGLVANFGELRPNHYHMGLDMRTDQKVNLPVYAAADGYIAKVKVEPFGFGQCIYINHPNGFTTLYAHLNKFYPELEKYIAEQQYKLQQWQLFLDIPPGLFPVKKGDFIALSGSTGGSQGPHVHFEIRDTKTDKVLNPLLFGMPIPDNVPPVVLRLAVYNRDQSTYEQTPKLYALKKVNGVYKPVGGAINVNFDKVSFAISAYDCFTGSKNPNGIFSAELFDNGKSICGFEMNNISYDETRYLNAHIDYKTRSNGGPFLQHLSRLSGYNDGIYRSTDGSDGIVSIQPNSTHEIKVVVSDVDQNSSTIEFSLQNMNVQHAIPANDPGKMFFPNMFNVFENSNLSFYLPETGVYDYFNFKYKEIPSATGKTIYQLHNTSVPVQNYFTVRIHDNIAVEDTGHVVMKRFSGSKTDYKKAVYENGWYKSRFREFGNFQLQIDHTPPTITPVGFRDGMHATKLTRIAFVVADNSEEIVSFTATLDGNWLRFSNDKGKVFIYLFDEHCGPGQHELKVVVEDLAGNKVEKVYRFTR
ncbi:MAG: M23 family metallopeptidase [Ferruginibacter sp.]